MYDATHASPQQNSQEDPAAVKRQTQEEQQKVEQVDPLPLAGTVEEDACGVVVQRDLYETAPSHAPLESEKPSAPPLPAPDFNPYASEDSDDDSMDFTFSFGDLNGDTTLIADESGPSAQAGKDRGAAIEHNEPKDDKCMQLDGPKEPREGGMVSMDTNAETEPGFELDMLLDEAIASIVSFQHDPLCYSTVR